MSDKNALNIETGSPWLGQDGGLRAPMTVELGTGEAAVTARSILRVDDEPARMAWAGATAKALGLPEEYESAICAETRRVCTAAMDSDDDGAALTSVGMRGDDPDVFTWRGMEIPLRAPQVLFGDPATYKSTACMHIALSMAAKGLKILYIDMENTPEDTERGFSRAARGIGKSGERALSKVYRTGRRQLHLDRRGKKLKTEIDSIGIDYVVIDSATMAVPGDLNSSADVKAFWSLVDSLSDRQIGCTVIAHTPKAKDNQASPLGSRVMTSFPRKVWKASSKGVTDVGARLVMVELTKSNDSQQTGAKTELSFRHLDDKVVVATESTGRTSSKDREREEAALTRAASAKCLERLSQALVGKPDGLGLAEAKRAMHAGSRQKQTGVDDALRRIREGEHPHIRFRTGGVSGRAGRYYRTTDADRLDVRASAGGAWQVAVAEVLTPETPELKEQAYKRELVRMSGCSQDVARMLVDRIIAGDAAPMLVVPPPEGKTRYVRLVVDAD